MSTQLNKIINHCIKTGLNEMQVDTIVEIYESEYVTPGGEDRFYNDVTTMSNEELLQRLIIPYNLNKMQKEMTRRINEGHHTVMNVSGMRGYSYSIGLSVNRSHPHELVVLANTAISHASINEIAAKFPDGEYPDGPITLECGRIKVGDLTVKIRAKIEKLPNPVDVRGKLFQRIGEFSGRDPEDFYVIYLGDGNNKLPGEDGYDETFIQTIDNSAMN